MKAGRSGAVESEPITPIDDGTVDATLAELPEVVADMVRLQRLTATRPAISLEALSVTELQHQTREAIDQIIDIDRFNQELEQERQEALRLSEVRYRARALLRDLDGA